ncbi:MAG: OmpW family outer membrane protein [Comamonadaceae bacterium]|nr:OmpW family outer membrane protein [Comamonadaceae bacterium]
MNKTSAFGLAVAAAATLAAAPAAWAQTAGSIMLRGGLTQIAPRVDSGNLTAPNFGPAQGTQIDVKSKTQLGGGLTYMVTDHLSLDLPLGTPFKHDIVGAGAIEGVGKIGTIKALPVTMLAQWRFREPTAALRPYVGAGLTYAYFFDQTMNGTFNGLTGGTPDRATTSKTDRKFGLALQLGMSYAINERWFVDASVLRTWLKTTSHLSSGQQIKYKLDPWVFMIGVGYQF